MTIYSAFDTTPSGAVAAIKAAILTDGNWSNPAGNRVVCTTTRGADMVVDLSDASATAEQLQLGIYRTSALADKIVRYLSWRASGGATSDSIHVIVSAGKEHLFISIEGPRAGETNAVNATFGSYRGSFFVGDIVPYFASDTTPAVVCAANTLSSEAPEHVLAYVSRNQGNDESWVTAKLASMNYMRSGLSVIPSWNNVTRLATADSKTYLFPYVVFEDTDGLRGRVSKAHNAGFLAPGNASISESVAAMFSKLTYDGDTYIIVPVVKGSSSSSYTAFGSSANGADVGPAVAVPFSTP